MNRNFSKTAIADSHVAGTGRKRVSRWSFSERVDYDAIARLPNCMA
jgi:hypothetical protein